MLCFIRNFVDWFFHGGKTTSDRSWEIPEVIDNMKDTEAVKVFLENPDSTRIYNYNNCARYRERQHRSVLGRPNTTAPIFDWNKVGHRVSTTCDSCYISIDGVSSSRRAIGNRDQNNNSGSSCQETTSPSHHRLAQRKHGHSDNCHRVSTDAGQNFQPVRSKKKKRRRSKCYGEKFSSHRSTGNKYKSTKRKTKHREGDDEDDTMIDVLNLSDHGDNGDEDNRVCAINNNVSSKIIMDVELENGKDSNFCLHKPMDHKHLASPEPGQSEQATNSQPTGYNSKPVDLKLQNSKPLPPVLQRLVDLAMGTSETRDPVAKRFGNKNSGPYRFQSSRSDNKVINYNYELTALSASSKKGSPKTNATIEDCEKTSYVTPTVGFHHKSSFKPQATTHSGTRSLVKYCNSRNSWNSHTPIKHRVRRNRSHYRDHTRRGEFRYTEYCRANRAVRSVRRTWHPSSYQENSGLECETRLVRNRRYDQIATRNFMTRFDRDDKNDALVMQAFEMGVHARNQSQGKRKHCIDPGNIACSNRLQLPGISTVPSNDGNNFSLAGVAVRFSKEDNQSEKQSPIKPHAMKVSSAYPDGFYKRPKKLTLPLSLNAIYESWNLPISLTGNDNPHDPRLNHFRPVSRMEEVLLRQCGPSVEQSTWHFDKREWKNQRRRIGTRAMASVMRDMQQQEVTNEYKPFKNGSFFKQTPCEYMQPETHCSGINGERSPILKSDTSEESLAQEPARFSHLPLHGIASKLPDQVDRAVISCCSGSHTNVNQENLTDGSQNNILKIPPNDNDPNEEELDDFIINWIEENNVQIIDSSCPTEDHVQTQFPSLLVDEFGKTETLSILKELCESEELVSPLSSNNSFDGFDHLECVAPLDDCDDDAPLDETEGFQYLGYNDNNPYGNEEESCCPASRDGSDQGTRRCVKIGGYTPQVTSSFELDEMASPVLLNASDRVYHIKRNRESDNEWSDDSPQKPSTSWHSVGAEEGSSHSKSNYCLRTSCRKKFCSRTNVCSSDLLDQTMFNAGFSDYTFDTLLNSNSLIDTFSETKLFASESVDSTCKTDPCLPSTSSTLSHRPLPINAANLGCVSGDRPRFQETDTHLTEGVGGMLANRCFPFVNESVNQSAFADTKFGHIHSIFDDRQSHIESISTPSNLSPCSRKSADDQTSENFTLDWDAFEFLDGIKLENLVQSNVIQSQCFSDNPNCQGARYKLRSRQVPAVCEVGSSQSVTCIPSQPPSSYDGVTHACVDRPDTNAVSTANQMRFPCGPLSPPRLTQIEIEKESETSPKSDTNKVREKIRRGGDTIKRNLRRSTKARRSTSRKRVSPRHKARPVIFRVFASDDPKVCHKNTVSDSTAFSSCQQPTKDLEVTAQNCPSRKTAGSGLNGANKSLNQSQVKSVGCSSNGETLLENSTNKGRTGKKKVMKKQLIPRPDKKTVIKATRKSRAPKVKALPKPHKYMMKRRKVMECYVLVNDDSLVHPSFEALCANNNADSEANASMASTSAPVDDDRVFKKQLRQKDRDLQRYYSRCQHRPEKSSFVNSMLDTTTLKKTKKTVSTESKSVDDAASIDNEPTALPVESNTADKSNNLDTDSGLKPCIARFIRRMMCNYGDFFSNPDAVTSERRIRACQTYLHNHGHGALTGPFPNLRRGDGSTFLSSLANITQRQTNSMEVVRDNMKIPSSSTMTDKNGLQGVVAEDNSRNVIQTSAGDDDKNVNTTEGNAKAMDDCTEGSADAMPSSSSKIEQSGGNESTSISASNDPSVEICSILHLPNNLRESFQREIENEAMAAHRQATYCEADPSDTKSKAGVQQEIRLDFSLPSEDVIGHDEFVHVHTRVESTTKHSLKSKLTLTPLHMDFANEGGVGVHRNHLSFEGTSDAGHGDNLDVGLDQHSDDTPRDTMAKRTADFCALNLDRESGTSSPLANLDSIAREAEREFDAGLGGFLQDTSSTTPGHHPWGSTTVGDYPWGSLTLGDYSSGSNATNAAGMLDELALSLPLYPRMFQLKRSLSPIPEEEGIEPSYDIEQGEEKDEANNLSLSIDTE